MTAARETAKRSGRLRLLRDGASDARGQASILLLGVLAAAVTGAFVLGAVMRGVGREGDLQRAADIAALAGARALRDAYPRLFEPARAGGRVNPAHLDKTDYLAAGRAAAQGAGAANAARVTISFPDGGSFAPVRIRVDARATLHVAGRTATVEAAAEAELAPGAGAGARAGAAAAGGGGYSGPLAYRQGKPMRPDVALAFDRLEHAARGDGVRLLIASAYRSDAEQAVLYARHPDPKWVAPPGQSLHRLATELDLGPPGAYGWLAAHASRFGFVRRYAWEPWHYGYANNARSAPARPDGAGGSVIPDFVPARYAPALADAAQRWNVSATLLAAQLDAESGFNPFARSRAGAQGIAQFMPGTARSYGLTNPFDADAAISAQAHLMRDLLRRFASVPLALAAYNAGPGPVASCGCVPAIPETQGYVARILGLMGGAGDASAGALDVRLVT